MLGRYSGHAAGRCGRPATKVSINSSSIPLTSLNSAATAHPPHVEFLLSPSNPAQSLRELANARRNSLTSEAISSLQNPIKTGFDGQRNAHPAQRNRSTGRFTPSVRRSISAAKNEANEPTKPSCDYGDGEYRSRTSEPSRDDARGSACFASRASQPMHGGSCRCRSPCRLARSFGCGSFAFPYHSGRLRVVDERDKTYGRKVRNELQAMPITSAPSWAAFL